MKPILTLLIALSNFVAMGQKKEQIRLSDIPKERIIKGAFVYPDTLYTFTEVQIKLVDRLLAVGDNGVATSDNYSRNQWKEYHLQVLKIDSAIKVQYLKYHPVKEQPIKK